jgi:PTS system nitrogen regulatory IIA component
MKLEDYLEPEFVISELSAQTKIEVLGELVTPLERKLPDLNAQKARKVLREREKLGTTGIGDGVAIPHGKVENLDDIVLVVGRSLAGVNFDALDHKPCHIFFLVLAPENAAGTHLRILAQISRLLKDKEFREVFLQAKDREELWNLLKST